MENSKLNLKKIISLGLGLGVCLPVVSTNSFGSAHIWDDPRMDSRLAITSPGVESDGEGVESDSEYDDESESYYLAIAENDIYGSLANDFLRRHGIVSTMGLENNEEILSYRCRRYICAWKISKLVQARNLQDDLKNLMPENDDIKEWYGLDYDGMEQAYRIISIEEIDQNVRLADIQKYVDRYASDVLTDVFDGMLTCFKRVYYDIDDNTLIAAERVKRLVGIMSEYICDIAKALLDSGEDMSVIDESIRKLWVV